MKMTLSLSIIALAVASFTGCTIEKEQGGIKGWFTPSENNEPISETDKDIVTKDFDIKDFTGLDISYNMEVTYKQGNTYKVTVKTTETVFKSLQVKNKNGMLTLEFPSTTPNKVKNTKVFLYVTAPLINSFDISGACKLYSDGFNAKDLELDASGACDIDFGKVECGNADIDCSGASKIDTDLKATKVDLDCSGACKMNASIQATEIEMDLSGAFEGKMSMAADNVEIDASGASNIQGSFHGKNIDLECSGSGKIDLEVDCEHLKAENSGVAKVKISGTADDVKVHSSGVSKIDTSKLNQL